MAIAKRRRLKPGGAHRISQPSLAAAGYIIGHPSLLLGLPTVAAATLLFNKTPPAKGYGWQPSLREGWWS
ncbi:MAG: hypothetical protein ABIH58_00535 [Patescibacteria group bacterium]